MLQSQKFKFKSQKRQDALKTVLLQWWNRSFLSNDLVVTHMGGKKQVADFKIHLALQAFN